jgi:hypothetical protein
VQSLLKASRYLDCEVNTIITVGSTSFRSPHLSPHAAPPYLSHPISSAHRYNSDQVANTTLWLNQHLVNQHLVNQHQPTTYITTPPDSGVEPLSPTVAKAPAPLRLPPPISPDQERQDTWAEVISVTTVMKRIVNKHVPAIRIGLVAVDVSADEAFC